MMSGSNDYIAIIEIFSNEFNQPKDTLLKLAVAVSGLLLMALLVVWL